MIGVVLMPVYLRYLGAEGLGLIGLYMMVQALLPLLDFGLSPVLSRDMSRFRAGVLDASAVGSRLRSLERLFMLTGSVIVLLVVSLRREIAGDWLQIGALVPADAEFCMVAIATAGVLRWVAGLHRSALVGLEKQALINGYGFAFATAKHVGVLPILVWGSSAATTFFGFHALVGLLELLFLRRATGRALPARSGSTGFKLTVGLREAWSMAGAMTFLSIVWILFSQIDKLILSRILSLAEYGYFSLAVSLAGGILILMLPLGQVLQPRMTVLASQGRLDELTRLYRTSSQGVAALFSAAGGWVALFAQTILFAWVGDMAIAQRSAPILFWYGIANALVGVLSLPFMLQFAFGKFRLHVIGNAVLCLFGLPMLAIASLEFGAVGAGITLCVAHLLFLLLWIPRVHRSLLPGAWPWWLLRDIGPGTAAAVGVLAVAAFLVPAEASRTAAGVWAVTAGALALVTGLLAGNLTRNALKEWYARVRES